MRLRRVGVLAALLALPVSSASAAGPVARVSQVGAAPASAPIELVLPLSFDDAGLRQFATSVSTPGSLHYGQYESVDALAARFGASAHARRVVLGYLRRVGARQVALDRTHLFAYATLNADVAQRLFATRLSQFRTARGSRFIAPTSAVSIPAPLRGVVTGVIGLNTQSLDRSHAVTSARRPKAHVAARPSSALPRTGTPSPSACAAGRTAGEVGGNPVTAGFTPNQYLTAYGFDALHSAGLRGQGERVALIEIDGFRYSDIKAFAQCFHLDIPALNGFGVGSVHHQLTPGGEATLDLEVLDAAASDLKAIDVYESRPTAADTLHALTSPLQNPGHRPQVISASLGLCENALVGAIGPGGIRTTEGALEMATAAGITVLASSGDQGSADCSSLSGQPLPRLAVNYPASSAWVTGVGGTNFRLNPVNQIIAQYVWNDTFVQPGSAGGGGASGLFHRPGYQQGTVAADRRAVPDVSMLGDIIPGYAIYCTASRDCDPSHPWTSVGGTSAATPLLAGGFALVDQQLRMHKEQDLGLVNPLLYAIGRTSLAAGVFSDVLNYDNDIGPDFPGIGRALGCCRAGRGFDEATGWGSVNLSGFAALALRTQPSRQTMSIPPHQKPVKRHQLLVTVSCALGCRAGAFALIRIGSGRPFEVDSRAVTLAAGVRKTLAIKFRGRRLRALRSAVRNHRLITAEVAAVILDAHNHVRAQTRPKRLRIKS